MRNQFSQYRDDKNRVSKEQVTADLQEKAALNQLKVDELASKRYLLDEETYNGLLGQIQPGASDNAPLPSGYEVKDLKGDFEQELLKKKEHVPQVGTDGKTSDVREAAREAGRLYLAQYKYHLGKGLNPQQAAKQARFDVIQKIQTDGQGQTFGILPGNTPGTKNQTPSNFFPSFYPGTFKGWANQSKSAEFDQTISEIKGGTLQLQNTRLLDSNTIDALETQINSGKPVSIPGYAYNAAVRLGVGIEEFMDAQFEAFGKDVRLSAPGPIAVIQNNSIDPGLQRWIATTPTQANINAAINLTNNYPASFSKGEAGYESIVGASRVSGSQYPSIAGIMWAAATNFGEREAYITDPQGNKMAAGSPKEYVDWANQQIDEDISGGLINPNMTYGELLDSGSLPERFRDEITQLGLSDVRPSQARIPGSSYNTNLTIAYITGDMTHGQTGTEHEHTHINYEDNPETKDVNEADSYIDQHDQMLNASMLFETEKGSNKYLPPSEWEAYTAKKGYPTTDAQRHGASRGNRKHGGFDFRSQKGSRIKLRNGARVIKVVRGTPNGDHVFVRFKDGSIVRLLHGKFSGVAY